MLGEKLPLKNAWKSTKIKLVIVMCAVVLVFNVLELQNLNIPCKPNASFLKTNNIPHALFGIATSINKNNAPSISNSTFPIQPEKKRNNNNKNKNKNKNKAVEVLSMSDMDHILEKNRASSMIPLWTTEVDEQMLRAKAEVENAPIVTNDRQLYAPIFRNLSTFKRSYELMEEILKVYVYEEGDEPVFHKPTLDGLYASEGWFMNQMEDSKHFLTDDPNKAHLFYIPFSSVNLRFSMYIPQIRNHKELVNYTKSYIELISTKYPFWNRTGGADHFVAACHDWATDETEHTMKTAIRALCSASTQKGFQIGKDVSLPATKLFHSQSPRLNIGGEPAHRRTTLAFFAGQMHGYLRPILVQHWENKDPDMAISGPIRRALPLNVNLNNATMLSPYFHYMKTSKYCLCPRGSQVWSPRVMESIYYECVPVIISDNFVPPLFEVLNWSAFSVILPETDVPRLKQVLLDIPQQRYLELGRGVREVRKHFLWNKEPVKYDLFHMILHSVWFNRLFQIRIE